MADLAVRSQSIHKEEEEPPVLMRRRNIEPKDRLHELRVSPKRLEELSAEPVGEVGAHDCPPIEQDGVLAQRKLSQCSAPALGAS